MPDSVPVDTRTVEFHIIGNMNFESVAPVYNWLVLLLRASLHYRYPEITSIERRARISAIESQHDTLIAIGGQGGVFDGQPVLQTSVSASESLVV